MIQIMRPKVIHLFRFTSTTSHSIPNKTLSPVLSTARLFSMAYLYIWSVRVSCEIAPLKLGGCPTRSSFPPRLITNVVLCLDIDEHHTALNDNTPCKTASRTKCAIEFHIIHKQFQSYRPWQINIADKKCERNMLIAELCGMPPRAISSHS